ncbi:isopentenyl-diphosphate Delta-isomerase [Flavobacteriaceae bacterium F08102]|nr:isopentenyl-diphosphate Delta-isomerase [Flavobacteriaceae bacterium F08102]
MKEEQVILVNEQDEALGVMGKTEAHEKGVLHRAFSVFIFNDLGELLLQQRAKNKYHSPLLWTNTCCSHQRIGENNVTAGKRRLQEEMGFSTDLKEVFSFVYKAAFDNGLIEHEYDHVMIGTFNDDPQINTDEVECFKWMNLTDLVEDIERNPAAYSAWFKIIFSEYQQRLIL